VRNPWCICLSVLILGAVSFGAQQKEGSSPADVLGTWTGSWEGAGSSGGFEIVLEKGKEDTPGGRVSVTGEPTYKATLKTVAFEGKKMTATYDFPPDDRMEIKLEAAFDGNAAKGTWSARAKSGGSEVVSGTWTVARK
jgi:hypothetical protein